MSLHYLVKLEMLIMRHCTKFHHQYPDVLGDIAKNMLVSFFSGRSVVVVCL